MSNFNKLFCTSFCKILILLTLFVFQAGVMFADQKPQGDDPLVPKTAPQIPQFDKNSIPTEVEIRAQAASVFKFNDQVKIVEINREKDDLGYTHIRYYFYYNGSRVEGGMMVAHILNGKIESINGDYFPVNVSATPSIDESTALKDAMQKINATTYRWQSKLEEARLKQIKKDVNATWFPKAELVYCPNNGDITKMTLAYKFDIYASEPLVGESIYVDALTGKVIYELSRIYNSDARGSAKTKYSGTQVITADSISSSTYDLDESGRGGGIYTYNMKTGTSYGSAVDFTDADNYWNNANAAQDEVAGDAHWGAEMTYDFYFKNFGRNSFDNAGGTIYSFVHYDSKYNNAFWDGTEMNYGDGDGTNFTPLTALDVCGHEISHGFTQHASNLAYQNESGAMDEGISDIFGTCIEFYAKDTLADWIIGKDFTVNGKGIRDMSAPKNFSQPNTYNGTYYVSTSGTPTSSNDWNGVHTNSGVLNYWFYLIAHGASGTNDNSKSYSVSGLGIGEAQKIMFRTAFYYLTSSSTFSDARNYSIRATIDLYGGCSNEVKQVTNAWYAVGVGAAYSNTTLSGTYTIGGTSPDFTTFTKAVAALNSRGVCGAVVFNVRNGSYKEQIRIGSVIGTSAVNTVTFQSQNLDSTKVILTYASSSSGTNDYTLELDSSNYINFRKMTIQRTGTNTYCNVVYLMDNASYNTISNNVLRGQYAYSTSLTVSNAVINCDGSATSNNLIYNNGIHGGLSGLYFYGVTRYAFSNEIYNNTVDSFGLSGIFLGYELSTVIYGNTVKSNSFSSTTYGSYGIRLNNCDEGITISRNQVYLSAKATYCRGIALYTCAIIPGYSDIMWNNFVRISSGLTTSTGIHLAEDSNMLVLYNNVLNNYSSSTSIAINVDNSLLLSPIDYIFNNNLVNKGGGYAFYVAGGSVYSANYNNLYTSGTYIGYYSSGYTSFSNWKTGTGYDANSKNVDPGYTSANDLHVSASGINGAAVPITGINDDIDGAFRDPITPDIGADEFGTLSCMHDTFTIGGTSPNYATFKAAVSDLTKKGVCGNVVFLVRNGTYTEQIRIGSIPGSSSSSTITFQSQLGDSSKVILQYASSSSSTNNYTLLLDTASYVTFRQMTIQRTGSSTYGTTIDLEDGASNNFFSNDRLLSIKGGTSGVSQSVIYTSGSVDNGNIFYNSIIRHGSYGIINGGTSSASGNNTWIFNNTIDSFYTTGIYLFYTNSPALENNSITTHPSGSSSSVGIDINSIGGSAVIADNIIYNKPGGYGIIYNTGSSLFSAPSLIVNNFITVASLNYSSGMYFASTGAVDVVYNNINITSSKSNSSGAYIDAPGCNIHLLDNNLVNKGGGFSLYVVNNSGNITSDYNNLYTSGSYLSYWNATKYASLSTHKVATMMDLNDVSVDPGYTNTTTDLHVSNSSLATAGTPFAGITKDIDGQTRSTTTPSIGADEFSASVNNDAGISALASPASSVCAATISVSATMKNFGANSLTSATVNWSVNGTTQTAYSWTGTLSTSSTTSIPLGNYAFSSGAYSIKVWTSSPNGTSDGKTSNDTLTSSITVNPLPSATVGSASTVCSGTATSIGGSSTSGHTYSWISNPSGFTSTSNKPSVSPTVTTMYILTETITSTGCSKTDSVKISTNPAPAVTVGGAKSICKGSSTGIGGSSTTGYTYSWTSNPSGFTSTSSNPSVSPTVTTVYKLTTKITATGCTKSDSVKITLNPQPTPSLIGATSVCANAMMKDSTKNNSGDTYAWYISGGSISSGSSTNSVVVKWGSSGSGSLKVVETNGSGCKDSSSVSITINAKPTPSVSGSSSVCASSSSSYSTTKNSGNTYSWTISGGTVSSGAGTNAIGAKWGTSGSGSVQVVETNSSGCKDSSSMSITINSTPSATIGSATSICNGDSITLGASSVSGNTYSWTSTPSGFTSSSSSIKVAPSSTITYNLTETTTASGCSKNNSAKITVNARPFAKVANDTTVCGNTVLSLGSSTVSGDKYKWTSNPTGFSDTSSNPKITTGTASTTYYLTETVASSGCSKSDSVVVTVKPSPKAFAGTSQGICNGSSVILGASSVAGNTYSWTSKPSGFTSTTANPNVSPTVNTTYYLTEKVTSSGCSKSDSVKITVNPLPSAAVASASTICSGKSTSIGATTVKGSKYSWTSNPSGFTDTTSNPSVSPTITTTYYLTETIASTGCQKSDSVIITVKATPAAPTASNNGPLCPASTLDLKASTLAGATYSWTGPNSFSSSSQNPSVTPVTKADSGLYSVTVTSGGCTSNAGTTSVTIYDAPKASISGSATVCSLSTQTYAAGTTKNKYSWTVNGGTISSGSGTNKIGITWGTSGKAWVKLVETNSNSCSDSTTDTVTVNPLPLASTGSASSICNGATAIIGNTSVAGNTYSWTSKPTGFTSTSSNPSVSPAKTTTYYLTETITASGCNKSDSVIITVNERPTPALGKLATPLCGGVNAVYSTKGNIGSSYNWTIVNGTITSGSGTDSIKVNWNNAGGKGTIMVVETNAAGCKDSTMDSIVVNPKPLAKFFVGKTCFGSATTFADSSTAHNKQVWYFGDLNTSVSKNPTHTYTATGNYTVALAIKNSFGCYDSASTNITIAPIPNAHFSSKLTGKRIYDFRADDTIYSSTSYLWNFGDSSSANGFNTVHAYSADSTYKIQLIINNSGCTSSFDSSMVIFTGIAETNQATDIFNLDIYPNPFNEITTLQYELGFSAKIKIAVYAMDGKLITTLAEQQQSAGIHQFILRPDNYNLNQGVYFLRMMVGDKVITKQLIHVK